MCGGVGVSNRVYYTLDGQSERESTSCFESFGSSFLLQLFLFLFRWCSWRFLLLLFSVSCGRVSFGLTLFVLFCCCLFFFCVFISFANSLSVADSLSGLCSVQRFVLRSLEFRRLDLVPLRRPRIRELSIYWAARVSFSRCGNSQNTSFANFRLWGRAQRYVSVDSGRNFNSFFCVCGFLRQRARDW